RTIRASGSAGVRPHRPARDGQRGDDRARGTVPPRTGRIISARSQCFRNSAHSRTRGRMTLASPIVHQPFNFGLGGFNLTGFGIAVLMAFLISQIISERELARRGHDVEAAAVSDVLFAALIGTIFGAKLYYVLVISHNFSDLWSRGGFVFWGGFIGSV